jgi:hypothetical protein
MQKSKHVAWLSIADQEEDVALKKFLKKNPRVNVNLFRNPRQWVAIHASASRGYLNTTRMLIDAKADLTAVTDLGETPVYIAAERGNTECLELLIESKGNVNTSNKPSGGRGANTAVYVAAQFGQLECVRVLIENKADVNAAKANGSHPVMQAAANGHAACVSLLINAKADIFVKTKRGTSTLANACLQDRLTCMQLLVDANADVSRDPGALVAALTPRVEMGGDRVPHVPGVPFAVLSCGFDTNAREVAVSTDWQVFNTCLLEYKQVHGFIQEYHKITKHALNEDVRVDKRVGRGGYGLYHEPLEQVLFYIGLSMKIDQTVNASIDGKRVKRALVPGHPTNANMWYELYQRAHCSSCGTRVEKPKKCPCLTARYCNTDCQREHWQTHKANHKSGMYHKTNER